ncbi:MAG TPA: magnesium transporter [candidate division WOR-3 bacterium]|uniref:Magnesium transporter MgtE n=1 Tax=candidate division WOR-3 bacterium TaxID=2052148 RepID=A0A7V0T516_UNCW3|nr:magnesium transporter [candidate division WOR-3 bacterium]
MKNPLLVPELREMVETGQVEALREFCETSHPVVVAEMLSALEPAEVWDVLRHASPETQVEVFTNLEEESQVEMLGLLRRDDMARLFADMPPDDRADLFKRLPEERQEAILPALAQAEREDVRRLASYEERTAGAIMTSDYATLAPGQTVGQAIERLRQEAPDKETIYYSYVLDESRRLLGHVSLKDLILARPDAVVRDIMHPDVISVRVSDDQEEAAGRIRKYDLLALPVVDENDALVGIITHDDALDVIVQEQTEDIEKLMAIGGTHEAADYIKTSAWGHFRRRVVWVLVLAALGLVSGFIVQGFESVLQQLVILAAFMPMLVDTGGNTGSQAATLVVRALALREMRPGDILRVLGKELQVALMLGLMLGLVAFGRVALFGGGAVLPSGVSLAMVGFAIAVALTLQVVTATLIGATLPMAAARLRLDPAVVASPALTTVVDITGLVIYFTTVKLMLGV